MSTPLFDESGKPVTLGRHIGVGGEGDIFQLQDQPDRLAKIYTVTPDAIQQRKLQYMLQINCPDLRIFTAWPQNLLHAGQPGGPIVGFVMEYFRDAVELKSLFCTADRVLCMPDLTWKSLVRIAENLAKAVAIVHKHQLVIGDLQPGNVLVNTAAIPRLIDCDSWQIRTPSEIFRCVVHQDDYLPPELHGEDYEKVDLNPDHDAFGLAVMIFQCLFLGKHPFAGRSTGSGPDDLATAIADRQYAFAANAKSRRLQPPADSLMPCHLRQESALLFERAFLFTGVRPTAAEWQQELHEISSQLVPCTSNTSHFLLPSHSECPICQIESQFHLQLFPNQPPQAIVDTNNAFVVPPPLEQFHQFSGPVIQIPIQPRSVVLPTFPIPGGAESSVRIEVWATRVILVAVVMALINMAVFELGIAMLMFGSAALSILILEYRRSPVHQLIRRHRRMARSHEQQASKLEKQLQIRLKDTDARIGHCRQAAANTLSRLQHRNQLRQQFQTVRHQRYFATEMRQWLQDHTITLRQPVRLTTSQLTALHTAGIKTAEHLLPHRIDNLTHIPQPVEKALLAWRKHLEAEFQCPPFQPPLDAAAFAHEFAFLQACTAAVHFVRQYIDPLQADVKQILDLEEQVITLRTDVVRMIAPAEQMRDYIDQSFAATRKAFFVVMLLFALTGPAFRFRNSTTIASPSNYSADLTVTDVLPVERLSSDAPGESKPTVSSPVERSRSDAPNEPTRSISVPVIPISDRRVPTAPSTRPTPTKRSIAEPTVAQPIRQDSVQLSDRHFSFKLALTYFHSGQLNAADQELRGLVRQPDADPTAGFLLAITCYLRNDPADGYQQLADALKKNGGKTPDIVFTRFETIQGPHRTWFENSRRELESNFARSKLKSSP